MADGSKIEWSPASWNPIRARVGERSGWHCEIITPGCENCYAQAYNHRLGTGDDYWKKSRRAEIFLDENVLAKPLQWKRPRPVFVCSMTDLFGDWVTDDMLDRIFAVMALCPQHTFQILTKRAGRMRDYMVSRTAFKHREYIRWIGNNQIEKRSHYGGAIRWPLPNVWLGVSVEDQRRADERIPMLLETPAVVRWVSAEPLLGPVDLSKPLALERAARADLPEGFRWRADGTRAGLDWVVIGGESGHGARPFNIEWARSIIRQCNAARRSVFMKQVGAKPYYGVPEHGPKLRDRKGGDPAEWPEDLRVRECPT